MADYFKVLIVVPFKHRSNTSRFVLPENLICNFLLELLGAIHVVNWTFRSLRSWRDFARQCFCFGSEAVNASGKAVRGLVKSRVEFPRGFAAKALAREIRGRPAREYGGSAARQLRRLDIPYK